MFSRRLGKKDWLGVVGWTVFLLLLLIVSRPSSALAEAVTSPLPSPPPPSVIIVNQIRGSECCDKGTITAFENQLKTATELQLPSYFALRYDALTDPVYQQIIKKYQANSLIEWGILLEVTPQLATASGVQYRGNSENWFHAEHVFPLGYELPDRYRLADTLVQAYQQQFSQKPILSTGWMIDAPTLQHLSQTHGLKLHQLTREQWGIDSYTLHGGPPHYPYHASTNWAFMPGQHSHTPVTIIRQTITDPIYNYGDITSSYTSQPNDYARGQRDISYFQQLLVQALDQKTQSGFAVLGLENSMGEEYQAAYRQQLEILKKECATRTCQFINRPDQLDQLTAMPLSAYCSQDFLSATQSPQACWVTSAHYRVRLVREGTNLRITDLRIYDDQLTDPYAHQAAQHHAYWVAPPVFDGALWRAPDTTTAPGLTQPQTDLGQAAGLIFPSLADHTAMEWQQPESGTLVLTYQDHTQQQRSITFKSDRLEFENMTIKQLTPHLELPAQLPLKLTSLSHRWTLKWEVPPQTLSHGIDITCQKSPNRCRAEFLVNPTIFNASREMFHPFLLPEARVRSSNKDQSSLFTGNRYTVAGVKPIVLYAHPTDLYGFPAYWPQLPQTQFSPQPAYTKTEFASATQTNLKLTLTHNQPGSFLLNLPLPDGTPQTTTVHFAPDCSAQLGICLIKPYYLWWYLNAVLAE